MSQGTFAIDDRDIEFVLFEHLRVQECFDNPGHQGFTREDADMILREAYRFAKEKLYPTRRDGDRIGCRFEDGEVTLPSSFVEAYRGYCECGYIGLTAGEDVGGSNVPLPVAMGVAEAMVGANTSLTIYPGLSRGVARVLENYGDAWMRQHIVPRLYSGEWSGTMCLTEPHAGTALGDLTTTAARNGQGWVMKGTKIFITGAEQNLTQNIVHLVLSRTEGAQKGMKGVSLFIVPKYDIDQNDGSLGPRNDAVCTGIEEKMGLHGASTCVLTFGDEGKCRAWMVGEEGKGIKMMFQLMNEARIGTGLHGMANAAAAYQLALAYARERVQGVRLADMRDVDAERVTIAEHPDVKRMLFDMKSRVEGMRVLLFFAAYLAHQARHHPDADRRAADHGLLELLTPICKAWCSDVGFEVTTTAIQVLGGTGYIRESEVEQLARDVKVASIYEGANGIQALDLVGRKLGQNGGAAFAQLLGRIGATIDANRDHPALGELAKVLASARDEMRETTGRLAQAGLGGDLDTPALSATAYLRMLANVVTGWLLFEQAVIAHDSLSALIIERNVSDPAQRRSLLDQSEEARYLDNKLHSVSFFLRNVLSENHALKASIADGHRGILEAVL